MFAQFFETFKLPVCLYLSQISEALGILKVTTTLAVACHLQGPNPLISRALSLPVSGTSISEALKCKCNCLFSVSYYFLFCLKCFALILHFYKAIRNVVHCMITGLIITECLQCFCVQLALPFKISITQILNIHQRKMNSTSKYTSFLKMKSSVSDCRSVPLSCKQSNS